MSRIVDAGGEVEFGAGSEDDERSVSQRIATAALAGNDLGVLAVGSREDLGRCCGSEASEGEECDGEVHVGDWAVEGCVG